MRLPVPERFNIRPAFFFAMFLFLGQQAAGTDIVFSLLTVAYVGLFVLAFNLAGGLLYPSGGFIFFNGVLTAIFGLTYKVFLFEPGQQTLLSGNRTMLAYCGGMLSMVVAAALTRRLRPKHALLPTLRGGYSMQRAAVGFLFLGVIITVLSWSAAEGSIASALRQINHFVPMAIVLGATYQFQKTGGKKSANWVVYASGLIIFAQGLLSFSKEGMFLGPVTWLVTVVAMGYSFSIKQIVGYTLALAFLIYYLVPYSQYVRRFTTESTSENISTALLYLGDLNRTRELYEATQEIHDTTGEPHLYSTPQGFIDRLTMLAFDDDLINYTDQGNVFGLLPTFYYYANVIPHFLWRDKPAFSYGNLYAKEIGVIPEEDVTTGISFSPTGDAYHQATWFGLLVVWPVVAFIFFFITDSLTGSIREAPWALLPITLSSHLAPEGLMLGTAFLSTYGTVALLAMVWFANYIIPLLTDLISGGRSSPQQSLPTLRPEMPVR